MACQTCKSNRILNYCAKSSDCNWYNIDGVEKEGYVPSGLNIGSGDYVEFELCLECGQVQGKWPVTQE